MNSKLLVLYLIEALMMIYIGISLFKYKLNKKRLISTALVYALSIIGVRMLYEKLHIPLGTHSIILLALFCLYCKSIYRFTLLQAIATAYISFTLIMIGEWVIVLPLIDELGLIVDSNLFNSWRGIMISATGDSILYLAGIGCLIKRYLEKSKS